MSQAQRALLSRQGVRVHAVLPGSIDTEMTHELDVPRTSPESAARAIFDGVERREEEIFSDPMSEMIAEGWRSSAVKAFERQMAMDVDASPVKSSKHS